GTRTYVYEQVTLGGVEGALSDAQGSAYIWLRMFVWHEEDTFYRLTVTSGVDEVDDAPPPSPELFGQLVTASLS
ncbi:MAG: hypothetical protein AAF725_26835, partial [Acidobacteriota bacterium]